MPEAPHRGILITRPAQAARQTAKLVAAMGYVPILAPLLRVVQLAADLPPAGRLQAVLITSANALPALGADLHAMPLLAVGDATAARARAAGFSRAASASGDARALARMVIAQCDPGGGSLLLASAHGEGQALAAALRQAGFCVCHHAVYAAQPAATLPGAAIAALANADVGAALFYSPNTARVFASLVAAVPHPISLAPVVALAISAAVAIPIADLPWRQLRVAARPNQDALLALLADEAP